MKAEINIECIATNVSEEDRREALRCMRFERESQIAALTTKLHRQNDLAKAKMKMHEVGSAREEQVVLSEISDLRYRIEEADKRATNAATRCRMLEKLIGEIDFRAEIHKVDGAEGWLFCPLDD